MGLEISEVCRKYGLPEEVAEALEKSNVTKLYPPQAEAVKKQVLEGKNMVLAVPTASGKTLIAEFCMLKSVLREKGKCIYIVPLRALASEKFDEFKQKYGHLGVKVGIATGDFDVADPRLAHYDILVATSEKVDSLLRHRAKWLAEVVSVVVLDEVHLIDDPGRGPTLEILTARLKQVNPKVQVLALSATIKNADEIAEWLGGELVKSEWRPVPLKKGVYWNGKIKFDDGGRREVAGGGEALVALALDTVKEGGQALVFVNTRRSAQSSADLLADYTKNHLKPDEREKLAEAANVVEKALGESSRTCRLLADCVRRGSAFHHAGLHSAQRKAVEDSFRSTFLKVICATPTLAAGVNLPSRRAIIRDYRRYVEPYGMQFIPVLEFHQMCGRAGRPQYDEYGEAVAIAHGKREVESLFEEFIHAESEKITSKLGTEPALRTHVLASIAAGYVSDEDGLLDFMGRTFFAHQFGTRDVGLVVERILDFLEKEDMISRKGKLLLATRFGELVSALYIDPLSAVVIRDGLKGVTEERPTDLAFLHLISRTPDMTTYYLRERELEEMEEFYLKYADELLVPIPDPHRKPEEFEHFLAELKTARMVKMWIEEAREDDIHEEFGIGAGDIRRTAETAEWLLHASHELARLFKAGPALAPLRGLQRRVRYGVKEELLELVQLRGIGRVRGRSLFRVGYKKLADIERATEEELAKVPYIGTEIARSIKRQVLSNAEITTA
ncbi:MAG: ATP-dependent DNA helicase [Candidatus Hadarchaeota archaeon]